MNRSETLRIEENTGMKITRPEIRRVQNVTEEIKSSSACVEIKSSS